MFDLDLWNKDASTYNSKLNKEVQHIHHTQADLNFIIIPSGLRCPAQFVKNVFS